MKKALLLSVLAFGLTITASAQGDQSGGGRVGKVSVNKILIGGDGTRGGFSDGGHTGNGMIEGDKGGNAYALVSHGSGNIFDAGGDGPGNGIIGNEGVRPFSGGAGSSVGNGFIGEGGTNAVEFADGNEKGNGFVTSDGGAGSHG